MKIELTYLGKVYHDVSGVTYHHFSADEGHADGRLITLPSHLFPEDLVGQNFVGWKYTLELKRADYYEV